MSLRNSLQAQWLVPTACQILLYGVISLINVQLLSSVGGRMR